MWRLLFLILVVLGSLAALLAVILGIGVAKVAIVNSDSSPAATVATQPARSFSPSTTNASGSEEPLDPARPIGPVVQKPAAPGAYVPGTIVLRAADAHLSGKLLQKSAPEGDLTNWSRSVEYAKWSFTPNRGKYRVLITRANGPGSGGEFGVFLSDERKRDPEFVAKATPTGGWDKFQSDFIGMLEFGRKRYTLVVRPLGDLAAPLMALRKIELVPVDGEAAQPPDPDEQEGSPRITGLTLVNATTGQPISVLTTGMTIDLGPVPISIRAETGGKVGSVLFSENEKTKMPPESLAPHSIAGDDNGRFTPWKPEAGKYTIAVTPFSEADGRGQAGKRYTVYVIVRSSIPLTLRADQAELHGDGLKVERGDEPNIGFWTSKERWVDWPVNVPAGGTYTVEMLYACEKGHGGEFVVQVGDQKLEAKTKSTDDWLAYERTTIGQIKLSAGQKRLSIKPTSVAQGKSLMKLRAVSLTPKDED